MRLVPSLTNGSFTPKALAYVASAKSLKAFFFFSFRDVCVVGGGGVEYEYDALYLRSTQS